MIEKLVGLQHFTGNTLPAASMSVDNACRILKRGGDLLEVERQLKRAKAVIYAFNSDFESLLTLADWLNKHNYIKATFDNGETLDLTRMDEVVSLFTWMKRHKKANVDLLIEAILS